MLDIFNQLVISHSHWGKMLDVASNVQIKSQTVICKSQSTTAIKRLKYNKARGADGLQAKLFDAGDDKLIIRMPQHDRWLESKYML